jgi:2-methylcitrate dehydratase PrpD
MPSLTEGLAGLLARPVDLADRARAALHLVDWLGCATAGSASEVGGVFRAHAATFSPGAARIIHGATVPARDAAFANGAFGNVLEMDDVHREAILHPGPVVIPAALALAAERNTGGPALLDAVVRGYEAMIRIGRAMGPAHYRHFHPTSTCGPFGAATACASLLGLDADRVAHALGNAGTGAGGVWQCRAEPVMTKQFHTARAAQAGLDAAVLAAAGLTGPRLILEGPFGVFAGLAPDARPGRVLAEPQAPWLIHATSFKPWPACRHCHPAIDAALALRRRAPPEAVAAVEVATYSDAIAFCDRRTPQTTGEAKFSLQHAVAVALLDGEPPLSAFDPPSLTRPDLVALRARVTLREERRLSAAYPLRFGAAVSLTLRDGTVLAESVPDALGDPENPLPEADLLAKARMLMIHAGSKPVQAEAAIAAALALASGAAARSLDAALPAAGPLPGTRAA